MNDQPSWPISFAMLIAAAFLLALLERIAKTLSPPESTDPRLGGLVFWLWVAAIGTLSYAALPNVGRMHPKLEALLWGSGALGWLAWKLGLDDGWEDSPRDREEIWATTVGIGVAFVAGMFTGRGLSS